jgi:hypothetical protein
MGSFKLHMEPIVKTVKNKCSKIKNNSLQDIMTLIILVCNSTSRYEGDNRPRVRVTQENIEQSFLYDTCHSKRSKESMARPN